MMILKTGMNNVDCVVLERPFYGGESAPSRKVKDLSRDELVKLAKSQNRIIKKLRGEI